MRGRAERSTSNGSSDRNAAADNNLHNNLHNNLDNNRENQQ